jgi:uncharacterized protein YndB with AHSA1/START domain
MPNESANTPETRSIEAGFRTTAPPERVWEAWADPARIAEWFTDGADGRAEVGSTFTWIFDRFGYRIPYTVLASSPGERWSLRWEGPGRPPGIIDVGIARQGGETVVRLVNSGFLVGAEWDEEYEGMRSGWRLAMALLKEYVERYWQRPKRAALVMRPAEFTYEELRPFYGEPPLLRRWLTRSGSVGKEGADCHLVLRDGASVTGRVIASTGTEAAVTWGEVDGVLELKTFAMGPEKRAICLRAISWSRPPEWVADTERWMTDALDRLAAELAGKKSVAGAS